MKKDLDEKKLEVKIAKNRFNLFIILSVIILFLIDILTKYYFSNKTYFKDEFFYILPSINSGSAFNMFSHIYLYNYFIGGLGVIFVMLLIYYNKEFIEYYVLNKAKKLQILILTIYSLLIAGILANTYDRLIFGHTRDFIGFGKYFIFNIADFYLTLVVILYLIYEIKNK